MGVAGGVLDGVSESVGVMGTLGEVGGESGMLEEKRTFVPLRSSPTGLVGS